MPTYITILRGVNVSGKNSLPMSELRAKLTEAGFEKVRTYIQSGNVLFEHKKTSPKAIEQKIEGLLLKEFGLKVPVIAIDADYLKVVLAENPFLNGRKEEENKLHVTFLAEEPDAENLQNIDGLDYRPDEYAINGKTIYLFCPEGYGRTKYNNNFFEKKLKVTATTRNWRTCNILLEMVIDA